MHFSCDLLDQPIDRAERLVALDLLAAAAKARKRLDDPGDTEALHDFRVSLRRLRTWIRAMRPWLGDSSPKKARRRLRKAARITGVSRDAEVRHQWLEAQRHDLPSGQRRGHTQLMRQIEAEKEASDRRVVAEATRAFDRARASLSRRLRSYRVDLEENRREAPRSFAVEMAELIRAHGVKLSDALARVRSYADAKEAHEARIAGRRLRHLVEVVARCVRGGDRLVTELGELQDSLGDWHDADVFAATIVQASTGKRARRGQERNSGVREIARRLEERGRTAFATIKDRWCNASALQPQIDAIAEELSLYGGHATSSPPALRLIASGKLSQ